MSTKLRGTKMTEREAQLTEALKVCESAIHGTLSGVDFSRIERDKDGIPIGSADILYMYDALALRDALELLKDLTCSN